MGGIQKDPLSQMITTCGSLLSELQIIWDEVGESEVARDKMLLELEQECLEVYRKKVDSANRSRAQLRQAIADSEAELAAICSEMGERPMHLRQTEQKAESLKEEFSTILSQLEEIRNRKADRKNQFLQVIGQIQKISTEIYGSEEHDSSKAVLDDNDLTLRRLEDLQNQLQSLQKEKSDRLKQVLENLSVLSSLCSVLGLDFNETVRELHPSLTDSEENHSISTATLQQLESELKRLQQLKHQRRQRLQDLASMLLEFWNLMDTPVEEQQAFQNVTCNIAASEDEITEPNMLSADFIKHVEAEVSRLEELKSSKMKELVLKKKAELEDLCQKTHIVPKVDGETEYLIEAIESGALDPAAVLEQIELEVGKVKEEAFSRKEILEKVEKWLFAREEEEWLEQYNMDENRYNAGRGAHLILKRAEKARTLVNKLPGMVEALVAKTEAWEDERGCEFLYDGIRLLSMLEEYIISRQEKEQDKKRQREQKKLQGQLVAEQDGKGSKSSPMKSAKKSSRMLGGGNNRGNMLQTPRPDSSQSTRTTPNSRLSKKDDNIGSPHLTVRRVLDKNYTFNGRETEADLERRPFSPISSRASARAHDDLYNDENLTDNIMQQQKSSKETSQQIVTTPSKIDPDSTEEHCNPKEITPAPFPQPDFHDGDHSVGETDEETEYSFEEIRAGFCLPDTQTSVLV
ncbi:65-kDa microtubule-associated protein 3 [Bienertia sinuspersici]